MNYVIIYFVGGWTLLFSVFVVYRQLSLDGTEPYERMLDHSEGGRRSPRRILFNHVVVPALAAALILVAWPAILVGRFDSLVSFLMRCR